MDKEFLDQQIQLVKDDIIWHTAYKAENLTIVSAFSNSVGLAAQSLQAQKMADYSTKRLIDFDKMLEVFYTARDLRCECK